MRAVVRAAVHVWAWIGQAGLRFSPLEFQEIAAQHRPPGATRIAVSSRTEQDSTRFARFSEQRSGQDATPDSIVEKADGLSRTPICVQPGVGHT
eukprot:3287210-Rhodomonas_salina.3